MEPRGQRNWYEWLMPVALIAGLVLLLSLDMQGMPVEVEEPNLLEQWLETVVLYLASLAEMAAAAVIGVAIVRGLLGFVRSLWVDQTAHQSHSSEDTRLALGRALVLGLEFTVASDILKTAVAPSREDLLILGVVVMLRTLLNNFLEREIREVEERRRERLAHAGDEQ